jgi:hypothetical protein
VGGVLSTFGNHRGIVIVQPHEVVHPSIGRNQMAASNRASLKRLVVSTTYITKSTKDIMMTSVLVLFVLFVVIRKAIRRGVPNWHVDGQKPHSQYWTPTAQRASASRAAGDFPSFPASTPPNASQTNRFLQLFPQIARENTKCRSASPCPHFLGTNHKGHQGRGNDEARMTNDERAHSSSFVIQEFVIFRLVSFVVN